MNTVNSLEARYQYFINEDKGIVVAKISYEQFYNDMVDEIRGFYNKLDVYIDITNIIEKAINKELHYEQLIAKASCNIEAGDIFDEDFGCNLATARLTQKISTLKNKIYMDAAKEIDFICFKIIDMAYKYSNRISDNQDRFMNLYLKKYPHEN